MRLSAVRFCGILWLAVWSLGGAGSAMADEPVTLDNVVSPGANSAEEPLAGQFSLQAATHFLDSAALDWQKTRKCFTCHTNYAYLMARPAISAQAPAHQQVRAFLEEQVTARWPDKGPRWDAEVVMTAAVLSMNDRATTGKLHETTRTALARMWSLQRADGGWTWLKCDWPPMESDDDFGASMALIAVGAAPEGYAQTPQAKAGVEKIQLYLKNNPPPTLHHRAMLLWAQTYLDGVLTQAERDKTIQELRQLQRPDGGWSLPSLGDWKRGDDKPQDPSVSDGYGTGFVVYVLRRAGVPADDPQICRGVEWLKTNQRASGRWYTRSLHKDNKHFITHAATALAILALAECGEIVAGGE